MGSEAPTTKLLIVNSNTNAAVTELMVRACADLLPGCTVAGVNAAYGPFGIGGRADLALSGLATLEAIVANAPGHDAVVVGCYSDPGLHAAREVVDIPVVGIGEASFLTAVQLGGRFAVVAPGYRVRPVIEEAVRACGLDSRFAGVVLIDEASLFDADPLPYLLDGIKRAVKDHHAEVAVIGGAAYAGLAAQLAAESPIPVVGSVEAAAVQALALARLKPAKAKVGSYSLPARKAMHHIPPVLARLLAKEEAR